MEKFQYCQSCGMPMGETDEVYGTQADGSKSDDYCSYCYQNGGFLTSETMEEMIETCVPHVVAEGKLSEAEARQMMNEFFPKLKRWQNS